MLRPLAALLLAVGLGLFLILASKLERPLVGLARALLGALAFVLGVAGLAVGVTGLTSETWWAAIAGGAILAVALRLAWALSARKRHRVRQPEADHIPLVPAAPEPRWRDFERSLDWVGREQARRAHKSIERFLAERDSPSLNTEHRALLLSCEKRVPELIDTCLDRCRNASGRECDVYVDSTLQTLAEIGEEAERARREIRAADDRRLETLHRYFKGAVDKDGQRPLP